MNIEEDDVVMVLGALNSTVAGTPVDQQNSNNAAFIADALSATAFLVNGSELSTEEVEQVWFYLVTYKLVSALNYSLISGGD